MRTRYRTRVALTHVPQESQFPDCLSSESPQGSHLQFVQGSSLKATGVDERQSHGCSSAQHGNRVHLALRFAGTSRKIVEVTPCGSGDQAPPPTSCNIPSALQES